MIMEEKKNICHGSLQDDATQDRFRIRGDSPFFLADKALTKFSLSISLLKGVFKVDVNSYLR